MSRHLQISPYALTQEQNAEHILPNERYSALSNLISAITQEDQGDHIPKAQQWEAEAFQAANGISNVYFNLIAEKINEIKVAKELIRQEIVQTNGSLNHIEVSISTFAKCARHSRIAECASPECTRHHQLTAGFADELNFTHQLFRQNIERIQLKFDRLMRQEGANLQLNKNDLKFLFNVQQQRFYLQLDQNATLAQEIDNLTQSAIDETTFEPQPSTSRGTGRFYRSRQAAQQQQAVDQQLQSLFEEIERVQRQYSESMSRTISAFHLNSQGY